MATKKTTTRKITKGAQVQFKSGEYVQDAFMQGDYSTVRSVSGQNATITLSRYNSAKGKYEARATAVPLSKLQVTSLTHMPVNGSYTARIAKNGTVLVGCQRISAKNVLAIAAEIRKTQRKAK